MLGGRKACDALNVREAEFLRRVCAACDEPERAQRSQEVRGPVDCRGGELARASQGLWSDPVEEKRMTGILSLGDISHAGEPQITAEVMEAVAARAA